MSSPFELFNIKQCIGANRILVILLDYFKAVYAWQYISDKPLSKVSAIDMNGEMKWQSAATALKIAHKYKGYSAQIADNDHCWQKVTNGNLWTLPDRVAQNNMPFT